MRTPFRSLSMSWQRLSRPAATFSCSTMALFTKPKRSCWPIILSPSSSRLTHPNSILLSGSGVTSKINWRVTCLPPWRNFLSRWLKLSLGIQPLTYAHLQRSLTSSRLLSQLMYTNHKETVLAPSSRDAKRSNDPSNEQIPAADCAHGTADSRAGAASVFLEVLPAALHASPVVCLPSSATILSYRLSRPRGLARGFPRVAPRAQIETPASLFNLMLRPAPSSARLRALQREL